MKWLLLFLGACSALDLAAGTEESVFAYAQQPFESSITPKSESDTYRLYAVQYPSPMTTAFTANNKVYGDYYLPRSATSGRTPAVIVLHILGGPRGVSELVAAHLARHDIAALHLVMPFYGKRREGSQRFLSTDIDLTLQCVRQAVMDIRRGVDWLTSRPEVDKERIGVAGLSLGAEMGCLSFCSEPRFRAAVLILGGGDLAKILTAGELTASRREKMQELGLDYDTLRQKLASVEPLKYADKIHRRDDVLMFNARQDEIVLPECANALWAALDKPRRYWLYAGHYTSIIYLQDVMDKTSEFFHQRFSP